MPGGVHHPSPGKFSAKGIAHYEKDRNSPGHKGITVSFPPCGFLIRNASERIIG